MNIPQQSSGRRSISNPVRATVARGLTIIEILVSIGIVAVLLAILLVSLGGAREAAHRVVSRSNLRQLHTILLLYTEDSAGRYPAVEEGRLYPVGPPDEQIAFPYWQIYETWTAVIYDYLPRDRHLGVFLSPGAAAIREPGGLNSWRSSYVYSTSFVAQPALWSGDAPADPAYMLSQRVSDVRFPSGKALLWDAEMPFIQGSITYRGADCAEPTPVLCADGSAADRVPADAAPAVINPFANPVDGMRLHNTPAGVHGINYH